MTGSAATLFRPAAEWPVIGEYDVVVLGAGPGGIGAALASARLGARTLLVERNAAPGGVATQSNCPHLMGLGDGTRQIVGGIADDLARRLGELKLGRFRSSSPGVEDQTIGDRPLIGNISTNIHNLRLVVNRLLREARVERLFYTPLIGAVTEGARVTAAAVDRAEGPGLIRGRFFVDATGDATLVWRAGGRVLEAEPDEAMTKTLIIDVGGVDHFDIEATRIRFKELADQGRVPVAIQDRFMGYASFEPGWVQLNYTAVVGDALQSGDLTRMDEELREQIHAGVAWYRENFPGFENCYLARVAERIGVRAGRSGLGRQTITQRDIDENTPVAEPVALGLRRYGDHGTKQFSAAWGKPVSGLRPIPWQTLLSADFGNVLLAGRAISVEPKMVTCVRYIGQCLATGQAAGTTAALAGRAGLDPAKLGYPAVRAELERNGAILA